MNLLLFLSALLTGFTGVLSGEHRTVAATVQHSADRAREIVTEATAQLSAPAQRREEVALNSIVSERGIRHIRSIHQEPRALDTNAVNEKWLV